VFIATGFVGGTSSWLEHSGEADRPMLTWGKVAELAEAGIECAAHGDRHLQLDTVPAATAAADIAESKAALERVIGPVDSFAYPHGYYTRRLQRQVARAGFSSACAVRDALSSSVDDPYALARLVVRGETGIDAFAKLVSGEEALAAPRDGVIRRGAWRTLRRAGAEPIVHRLRSRDPTLGRRTRR
jgi:peptidoglycan/xylan/chitin deacetylase (PgdA/CDA1 family)